MEPEIYFSGDPDFPVQVEFNHPLFELEIKLSKEQLGDIFHALKEDGFFDDSEPEH